MATKRTAPVIHIGSSQGAIKEARGAINDILRANAESAVKTEALRTLATLCNVNGTSIMNTTVNG